MMHKPLNTHEQSMLSAGRISIFVPLRRAEMQDNLEHQR